MKSYANLKRILGRSKAAALMNVVGLSTAFAAFLLIIMQTDFDRSFDSCHRDAERIYRAELEIQGQKFAIVSRPIAGFLAGSPAVESSALADYEDKSSSVSVDRNGVPVRFDERTRRVSPSFTDVFHFEMREGSAKALAQPGQVLVPESLAKKLFGEQSALGKRIDVAAAGMTVGGVYEDFPENSSVRNVIYTPIPENETAGWGDLNYSMYVKTVPSVGDPAAEFARLGDALSGTLKQNEPNMPPTRLGFTSLRDLHYVTGVMGDRVPKANRQTVLILLSIALAVVVVAGINYMNFNMALLPGRMKAINVHKILGAGNRTVRIDYLLDSVAVSLFSFVVALLLVLLASRSPVASLIDADVSLRMHSGLVAVAAAVAVAIGVLAGLSPSHYATSFQPALVLKGASGVTPGARKLRQGLIGLQFLTAYVLIICSWLMLLQNDFLRNTDSGYDKEQVVLVDMNGKIRQNWNAFADRLKSVAGVESATYASAILSGTDTHNAWVTRYEGKDIMFHWIPVDPSFLKVLNIEVAEGRDFNGEDRKKYIFNEKARKQYELTLNARIDSVEIVGFIPDIQYTTFRTGSSPMAFYVTGESGPGDRMNYAYVKVGPGTDMGRAIRGVRSVVKEFETDTPLRVRFYDDLLNGIYEKESHQAVLVSLFSLIAVVISTMGVLGLVFFESASRRKEIGIRKVMGSTETGILFLFNRSYLAILGVSFLFACPIAYYGIGKWMENFSKHTPLYWWVFLGGGLFVVLITVVSVSWRSWRAASCNPLDVIHTKE